MELVPELVPELIAEIAVRLPCDEISNMCCMSKAMREAIDGVILSTDFQKNHSFSTTDPNAFSYLSCRVNRTLQGITIGYDSTHVQHLDYTSFANLRRLSIVLRSFVSHIEQFSILEFLPATIEQLTIVSLYRTRVHDNINQTPRKHPTQLDELFPHLNTLVIPCITPCIDPESISRLSSLTRLDTGDDQIPFDLPTTIVDLRVSWIPGTQLTTLKHLRRLTMYPGEMYRDLKLSHLPTSLEHLEMVPECLYWNVPEGTASAVIMEGSLPMLKTIILPYVRPFFNPHYCLLGCTGLTRLDIGRDTLTGVRLPPSVIEVRAGDFKPYLSHEYPRIESIQLKNFYGTFDGNDFVSTIVSINALSSLKHLTIGMTFKDVDWITRIRGLCSLSIRIIGPSSRQPPFKIPDQPQFSHLTSLTTLRLCMADGYIKNDHTPENLIRHLTNLRELHLRDVYLGGALIPCLPSATTYLTCSVVYHDADNDPSCGLDEIVLLWSHHEAESGLKLVRLTGASGLTKEMEYDQVGRRTATRDYDMTTVGQNMSPEQYKNRKFYVHPNTYDMNF
jgi:hypothetical protein